LLGFSQQLAGDTAAARATYQKSVENFRRQLEKVEPDSGFEPYTRALLGAAYAGLGEAASAIAEGQKAISLLPSSKNPEFGPNLENDMARIYARLGDADHAIPHVQAAAADTVCRCDVSYSGDAATRSNLGSNPQ
jgi:hypothetical protein